MFCIQRWDTTSPMWHAPPKNPKYNLLLDWRGCCISAWIISLTVTIVKVYSLWTLGADEWLTAGRADPLYAPPWGRWLALTGPHPLTASHLQVARRGESGVTTHLTTTSLHDCLRPPWIICVEMFHYTELNWRSTREESELTTHLGTRITSPVVFDPSEIQGLNNT